MKKKIKIYFAGAIRGGRADVDFYFKIINHLRIYGEVLTEHIGDNNLSVNGEKGLADSDIHDRDLEWLLSADVLIAEVSTPSLGVGYEIGRAIENDKNVLCLYHPQKDKKLSGMINGCRGLVVKKYNNFENAKSAIDDYFKRLN